VRANGCPTYYVYDSDGDESGCGWSSDGDESETAE
jgi:hypothetical protein